MDGPARVLWANDLPWRYFEQFTVVFKFPESRVCYWVATVFVKKIYTFLFEEAAIDIPSEILNECPSSIPA